MDSQAWHQSSARFQAPKARDGIKRGKRRPEHGMMIANQERRVSVLKPELLVVGKGCRAAALAQTLALAMPVELVDVGVPPDPQNRLLGMQPVSLQQVKTLIACCTGQIAMSEIVLWITALRAVFMGEFIMLVDTRMQADKANKFPLFSDHRERFSFSHVDGHTVMHEPVALGRLITRCASPPWGLGTVWRSLQQESAWHRALKLKEECEIIDIGKIPAQLQDSTALELAQILAGNDLDWACILCLDPHRLVYPEGFKEALEQLRQVLRGTRGSFGELWPRAKGIMAFSNLEA